MASPGNALPNSNALSELEASLNQLPTLQSLSIRVCHSHQTLKIFIESEAIPDKKRYCQLLRQALRQVNLRSPHPIFVYGRKTDNIFPSWYANIALDPAQAMPGSASQAKPLQPQISSGLSSPQIQGLQDKATQTSDRIKDWLVKHLPASASRQKQLAFGAGGVAIALFAFAILRTTIFRPSASSTNLTALQTGETDTSQSYSLKFDGKDDIAIAAHTQLPPFSAAQDGFSMSLWIYPTQWNTHGRIIERTDNMQSNRFIFILNHEQKAIHFGINGTNAIGSKEGITLNQWHHVAGTYDGETIRVYVDGELEAETPYTEGLEMSTSDLLIGNNPQNSRPYAGGMNNIQLWNRTLTPTEIQQSMTPALPADTTGLIAHWAFEETTASTIPDRQNSIPLVLQTSPRRGTVSEGPTIEMIP